MLLLEWPLRLGNSGIDFNVKVSVNEVNPPFRVSSAHRVHHILRPSTSAATCFGNPGLGCLQSTGQASRREHLRNGVDGAGGSHVGVCGRRPRPMACQYHSASVGVRTVGLGKTSDSPDGGAPYRALVKQVVDKIRGHNAYVILDLHWSDGGVWGQNIGQHALPDVHSLEFWKSCAVAYANDPAVIFDLYNEPIKASWPVWRNGGQVSKKFQDKDLSYEAVGLQQLLDAIRATGAKNLIHAGGLGYSSQLDFPDSALLSDPQGNGVVYVSHFYPGWENVPSWQVRIEKAAKRLPLIVEEFGDAAASAPMDTPEHRIGQIMAVLRKDDFNWVAWCMHPSARPCLIADWNYKPTPEFGALIKAALAGKEVPIAPRRTSAPDFKVYDGKLEDPWQSWSSAKVDLSSGEPGHPSRNSIHATIGSGQQLQLGTVPFDGLAYRGISFWIKAAPGTTADLTISAGIMDKGQQSVNLPPVGDQWTKVTISFDQLGVAGMEDIKSLMVRSQDGGASSEIYLDDVEVLGR